MKKQFLILTTILALIVSLNLDVQARGRRGSHRVGGYNSHGKGSHYVGGH